MNYKQSWNILPLVAMQCICFRMIYNYVNKFKVVCGDVFTFFMVGIFSDIIKTYMWLLSNEIFLAHTANHLSPWQRHYLFVKKYNCRNKSILPSHFLHFTILSTSNISIQNTNYYTRNYISLRTLKRYILKNRNTQRCRTFRQQ